MRRQFFLASAIISWSLISNMANANERNPVGERANYQLDRAAARTSSLIQQGTIVTSVTKHLPDHQDGASYEAQLDYDLTIRFGGRQQGNRKMALPEAYFTPEFLSDLRSNGRYESPQFKVEHLGYANARNLDGKVYENCDKIRIYDVQSPEYMPFAQIGADILQLATGALIEDLVIVAHIKEGEPVLGAVKLDITGKYNGIGIKAGADYVSPE